MNSSDPDRETFPEIAENIGEDPARFLDRPLYRDRDSAVRYPNESILGDPDRSAPGFIIKDRIEGIRRLDVLACYETVERRLDRGPREEVLQLIASRRAELLDDEPSELPTMTAEERRERARDQYEDLPDVVTVWRVERDQNGEVVEREPFAKARSGTASAKLNRLSADDAEDAVATDGGRDE